MIYFWNDKQLARDLKSDLLTEKQKFTYLIAGLVLGVMLVLATSGLNALNLKLHPHTASMESSSSVTISPDLHFSPSTFPHAATVNPAASNAFSHANPVFRISIYIYLIIVLIFFFRTNQKGDGKNILERYICLTFPVFVRTLAIVTILGIGIGFLVGIYSAMFSVDVHRQLTLLTAPLICILMGGYYFLRMQKLFKIASGQME